MIKKLYNLKKLQTNQQLLQKQQLKVKISSIEDEIETTHQNISGASVQTIGAISDFKILEMHKNTMREHIVKLNQQKSHLQREVIQIDKLIVELNKETEQFKYIKELQEKEKFKKMIKDEELVSAEYVQALWKAS
jgi:predicted unusual protein kinase regulating ubiquinone biosynthesis (AarF/ABC1/UbiB family)